MSEWDRGTSDGRERGRVEVKIRVKVEVEGKMFVAFTCRPKRAESQRRVRSVSWFVLISAQLRVLTLYP